MQAGIFSLSWDNIDPAFVECQKLVFEALDCPVNQHRVDGFQHADWIDWVLRYHEGIDIFVFIDADAVPLSQDAINYAILSAQAGRVFGCAQAANHIVRNRDHVYAGPFFMSVARSTWDALGRPSMSAGADRDVAQGLTLAAEAAGCEVDLWYPTSVEEPRWRLGQTGQAFGIGTTYNHSLYHLFESRGGRHRDRFVATCERVVTQAYKAGTARGTGGLLLAPEGSREDAAPSAAPEAVLAASTQAPNFSSDWFSRHIPVWQQILAPYKGQPVKALEIGSYEGRASIWLCENLLTHPDASLTCVDLFSGDGSQDYGSRDRESLYQRFVTNTSPYTEKIRVMRGESGRLLRSESPDETYEFVYIDGSHKSWHVLEDAVMAWPMLKTGGIMLFDDYMGGDVSSHHYPHAAINAFVTCHQHEIEVVHQGYQIALRKVVALAA